MLQRVAAFFGIHPRSRQWRGTIIGLVVLGVVLFETIEHRPLIGGNPIEVDFVRDVLFYGVVAMFAASYIVDRIERLSFEYQQSKLSYNHLLKFKEQLFDTQDYQEASAIYLQALRANITISGAQLLLYNPNDASFHRAASWPPNSAELPLPVPQRGDENCSLNKTSLKSGGYKLTPCVCIGDIREQAWPCRYCYSLTGNDKLVAVLYLYHTEALNLYEEREKFLSSMAFEILTTLERIQLQESLDKQEITHVNIQQRIARDMHATLGHNLAYLRMKLNQIPADYRIGDESILNDLTQLQDTANETYQQMRDLLVALTPEKTPNLRSTMTKYAQRVADRVGFSLEIQKSGESRPLKPVILQQVILILREALGNIEKHAQAHHVEINLDWGDEGLSIHIMDDGRGFDTSQHLNGEHFGLLFMQERASEVNGELILRSTPNSGTKISLWVPY